MKYLAMFGGLMLTLAVAGRAQVVQADCEERLDNNAYLCEIIFSEFPDDPFEECLVFNSDTPVLGDFDLFVQGLGANLGCSCETKNKKKFKKSNSFLCVAAADNENSSMSNAAVVFGGKATSKGKKIKKGQIVFDDGSSYIYTCKLEPTCGPPI